MPFASSTEFLDDIKKRDPRLYKLINKFVIQIDTQEESITKLKSVVRDLSLTNKSYLQHITDLSLENARLRKEIESKEKEITRLKSLTLPIDSFDDELEVSTENTTCLSSTESTKKPTEVSRDPP